MFLQQRIKLVVTTDLSVKATVKSVRRTVFGWLEPNPNFLLTQQILVLGEAFGPVEEAFLYLSVLSTVYPI
jgi:hypothetical protein